MNKLITIDGLSSSGKSTLSCRLACELGWHWFSTGVIYRGIAYIGDKNNLTDEEYGQFIDSDDWEVRLFPEKTLFFYKGEDITSELYSPQVDECASVLSAKGQLRKKLIVFQQDFFTKYPDGLIAEGRDCGTVIFKQAAIKIFLKANETARASRRYLDRNQKVQQALDAQKKRDERDKTRSFAPAIQPEGSLVIDTAKSTFEDIVNYVYQEACKKGLNKP